jgi:hypothetical protein
MNRHRCQHSTENCMSNTQTSLYEKKRGALVSDIGPRNIPINGRPRYSSYAKPQGGQGEHVYNIPVIPIPFSTVALNMRGIAPAYIGWRQKGHMNGQSIKLSSAGTRDARGSYFFKTSCVAMPSIPHLSASLQVFMLFISHNGQSIKLNSAGTRDARVWYLKISCVDQGPENCSFAVISDWRRRIISYYFRNFHPFHLAQRPREFVPYIFMMQSPLAAFCAFHLTV